ncbi:interferon alpha-inducible protein 27-like protein 2A [Seriola dumerili]|uniref:Interferon alpha-inducible protein 27-like protein 2A n=1 Tax=Seriola dumerili TaxID=41447 RepID=A0A3B4UAK4_SERDU|nr:interferon alpha-inducible protein 27-like protein 2A [Seriola dumerili]
MGISAAIEPGEANPFSLKWDEEEIEEEEEEKEEKDDKEKEEKEASSLSTFNKVLIGTTTTVVGGVGAVALAPVVLGAVGFTSAGIAAGSFAASMMSSAAIANGGGIAAGSLVAILQSAGAVGLSGGATAAVAGAGGTVGWLASLIGIKAFGGKKDKK